MSNFAKRVMNGVDNQQFLPAEVFRSFLREMDNDSTQKTMSDIDTRLASLQGRVSVNENQTSTNKSLIETLADALIDTIYNVQMLQNMISIKDNTLYIAKDGKTYTVSLVEYAANNYPYVITTYTGQGRKYIRSASDDVEGAAAPYAWKYVDENDNTNVSFVWSNTETPTVGSRLAGKSDGTGSWSGTEVIKVVFSEADE